MLVLCLLDCSFLFFYVITLIDTRFGWVWVRVRLVLSLGFRGGFGCGNLGGLRFRG